MGALWDRITRRGRDDAVKREAELEQMSPAERRFAEEGVENIAADELVGEQLGGRPLEDFVEEDEPPRS